MLSTGGMSTRFDLLIEACNIESIEEDFHELNIEQTEIEKIIELSKDPKLFDKLISSIAPSIYGYEKEKEALLLPTTYQPLISTT